jgi:UDP-2-acetamido-2-deoxy-ribo-hexuluronate aminotransferase
VTVASGSDALLIALMALGIGPGDEVVTVPFTFFATAEMIALIGARPVFVDIDPRTYSMDPARLEAAITPRTKAIMPVSLYGQCADFDAINAIARAHGLPVIEDAAQSFGATYHGRRSSALSTIGATSFFPSKPLGAYGDGGALFTSDDALAALMREIRLHGQDGRYHHPRLGLTGRLDSIQAAVLLAKMEIFEDEVAARIRLGARYTELIVEAFGKDSTQVRAPHIEPHNTSVYAQYTVEVESREFVETRMQAHGVPTAVHYPLPLHLQPVFANLGHGEGRFPVSEAAARRVISLPMHPYLSDADQVKVVAALQASVAD